MGLISIMCEAAYLCIEHFLDHIPVVTMLRGLSSLSGAAVARAA